MDLASIIGIMAGVAILVVVLIMDGGSPAELFSHPSAILLIFGGSLAATTISSSLNMVLKIPSLILLVIRDRAYNPEKAIDEIAKMADKARREGLLALEEESKKIKDPFLQKGIMLVVDGVDPAQVRAILETIIEQTNERHRKGYGLFTAAGGFAPTFGIIGTVMGLISVLKQLDDPNSLARSIAGAFLATLWGLLSANLIFLPIGGKLRVKSELEIAYLRLLLEGVLALQSGENPRIVREKLSAYLPPQAARQQKKAAPQAAVRQAQKVKA